MSDLETNDLNNQNEKNITWDTEKVLEELGMGRYQFTNIVLIGLVLLYTNLSIINYVFTAVDLPYRCKIPQCDYQESSYVRSWLPDAIPFGQNEKLDKCTRYPLKNEFYNITKIENCTSVFDHEKKTVKCHEWIYKNPKSSIVPDFGLACDFESISIVGSLHSLGLFIGIPLSSIISDNYGRRNVVIIGSSLSAIFGVLRSFSSSFLLFIIFEILEAVAASGVYSTALILGMELVVSNKRPLVGTIFCNFYPLGGIFIAGVAWWSGDWRTTLRTCYAPALLFITYYWLVHESIRWLRVKGRDSEALIIVENVSRVNKKPISRYTTEITKDQVDKNLKQEVKPKNPSILVIFKSKALFCRVMIFSYCFITMTLVYYGLSVNSVSLNGNQYVNFMISNAIDIVAGYVMLPVLKNYSRRLALTTVYIGSAISCVAFQFVRDGWMQFMFFGISKFMIALSGWMIYIYSSEIFPTELRSSLTGLCNMMGRIGSMAAPQTILLTAYFGTYATILLFGFVSLIAGMLVLLLPDTRNRKLMDKVDEKI